MKNARRGFLLACIVRAGLMLITTPTDVTADAFSSRVQILGSLNYGQTSDPIVYGNPPRFRAFPFTGGSGDSIDVWVRSTDGDAVMWVTDAQFNVLAYNDDASESTTDSHVNFTLPSGSGTSFYIIFREYWLGSAQFRVTLSGTPPTYLGVAKVRPGIDRLTNPAYKIRPNSQLSGLLGRLIFSFPEKGARGEVDIIPVGTKTAPRRVIINQQTLLPPGEYDVALNGTTLQRVLVRSRMDAVVRVGALKIVAPAGADLFDAKGQRMLMRLTSGIIVLPIGQYTVKVGGVFKGVVIVEGEVFDG